MQTHLKSLTDLLFLRLFRDLFFGLEVPAEVDEPAPLPPSIGTEENSKQNRKGDKYLTKFLKF